VQRQTRISLDVVNTALQRYKLSELSVSYNGGKDCLVLLILFLAGLHPSRVRNDSHPTTATANDTNSSRRIWRRSRVLRNSKMIGFSRGDDEVFNCIEGIRRERIESGASPWDPGDICWYKADGPAWCAADAL
jgi:hypothetical protein